MGIGENGNSWHDEHKKGHQRTAIASRELLISNKNAGIKSLCTIRVINDFYNVIAVILVDRFSPTETRLKSIRFEGGENGRERRPRN